MRALIYHEGQRAVQDEANTRRLADNLAHWNGPVVDFASHADFLLFATHNDGYLRFATLSGDPPLVEIAGPSALRFVEGLALPAIGGAFGGLAINLATARRVRLNGAFDEDEPWVMDLDETFTLCRKYMAPSMALGGPAVAGPASSATVAANDAGLVAALAAAETVFIASATPEGAPDVAHRGGPAGFARIEDGRLEWPEYLGDGVFKSAGNVRSTGRFTMLIPDFTTGDGYEVACVDADYRNLRTSRRERIDPLVQDGQPYPVQGLLGGRIERAWRVERVTRPRARLEKALRVTSKSTVDEQAPQ